MAFSDRPVLHATYSKGTADQHHLLKLDSPLTTWTYMITYIFYPLALFFFLFLNYFLRTVRMVLIIRTSKQVAFCLALNLGLTYLEVLVQNSVIRFRFHLESLFGNNTSILVLITLCVLLAGDRAILVLHNQWSWDNRISHGPRLL